ARSDRGAVARDRRSRPVTDRSEPGERPLLIGLTGPIGCGKSTVAGWLAEAGAVVIDADAIAREVTAPGEPGHDLAVAAFGDAVRRPDGSLDRAALGRRVFSDPAALRRLETIVHPLVRPRILRAIENGRSAGAKVIALEAIKLIESGYAPMCDEVWLVTCPADDQLERLVRRGMTSRDAGQRIAAQAGISERLARAAS